MNFKKYDKPQNNTVFRKALIEERGCQCEWCHNTTWLNQPIKLELHHIDGDNTNNTKENLLLLCPNCHSYTENYAKPKKMPQENVSDTQLLEALINSKTVREALLSVGMTDAGINYQRAKRLLDKFNCFVGQNLSNEQVIKENFCPKCGKMINLKAKYCRECANLLNRAVPRPSREVLKQEIRTIPFTKLGDKYNVSDKAITKWCISYNLPSRKKDIKFYSDEEWEKI